MIRAEGVSKSYGSHQALKPLDLSISEGKIFGLLGPNGAGKTSFIRILNQITAPDQGQIFFKDEPLVPEHIRKIGYLPEERGLYPKMRIGEQLLYLAQLKGVEKAAAKELITHWLKRFSLWEWKDKTVEELSKGMAQKVQFIATVLHQPELIILDEPFTGFDPINTEAIKNEIQRLKDEGASIIFSTHRMESVEQLCDDIALINKGQKILAGPLDEIKKSYRSGLYSVVTEKPIADLNASLGQVQKKTENRGLHRHIIKVNDQAKLLNYLVPLGLIKFEAEEVSLNEIFIKAVESA